MLAPCIVWLTWTILISSHLLVHFVPLTSPSSHTDNYRLPFALCAFNRAKITTFQLPSSMASCSESDFSFSLLGKLLCHKTALN